MAVLVRLSDRISDPDVVRRIGKLGTSGVSWARSSWRTETNTTRSDPWAVPLSAHNPEVAGSNPAPATNVVAGQRPFPIGKGPLACVARDQIRDQIADQRRLSRPTPSQAERRIEIRGTYCIGSEHLGRGRRVETPAVAPGNLGDRPSEVPLCSWRQDWCRRRRPCLRHHRSGLVATRRSVNGDAGRRRPMSRSVPLRIGTAT